MIVFIVSKFSTFNQRFTEFTQTWFMAYSTEFEKVLNGRYIEQMLHSLTKLGDDNSWVMLDWRAKPGDDTFSLHRTRTGSCPSLIESSEMVLCPILWGINLSHIYAREVR